MDIPFIRFAFPLLILYLFWYNFVTHPWEDDPNEGNNDPNYVSQAAAQELLLKSRQLIEASKFQESLAPLGRLHRAFPENHIYVQSLAQSYERLSQFKEAAAMWELYLQYSPTPIEGCPQIGLDYREQGKSKEAFNAFERCHTIEENSDTLLFYANALEREGRISEALAFFQKAYARAPEYSDVIIGLARVEAKVGKAAAARPLIDRILAIKPMDSDALLAAGLIYSQLGDNASAVKFLKRARERSPDYKDIDLILRGIPQARAAR